MIDNNNDVWCGTDYGVNYYDGKSWQSFTTSEGLAGSQILHIGNGKSGDIWFSSFGGISRYSPTK
jgi:ligand-binding sensor domain-containing protein